MNAPPPSEICHLLNHQNQLFSKVAIVINSIALVEVLVYAPPHCNIPLIALLPLSIPGYLNS